MWDVKATDKLLRGFQGTTFVCGREGLSGAEFFWATTVKNTFEGYLEVFIRQASVINHYSMKIY